MKVSVIITLFLTSLALLTLPLLSSQNAKATESTITDVVVEYTSEGEMVQIGHATIVIPETIMIDNGSGQLITAKKDSLKLGQLVKATLGEKTENIQKATQLIIYLGAGINNALKMLSTEEYAQVIGKVKNVPKPNNEEEKSEKVATPQAQTDSGTGPRIVNGVWTN